MYLTGLVVMDTHLLFVREIYKMCLLVNSACHICSDIKGIFTVVNKIKYLCNL